MILCLQTLKKKLQQAMFIMTVFNYWIIVFGIKKIYWSGPDRVNLILDPDRSGSTKLVKEPKTQ